MTVQLTVYNDNPGEILNRIKYYDADGKEIKNPQQQSTSYSGDGFRQSVEVTLLFPAKTKPPVKLEETAKAGVSTQHDAAGTPASVAVLSFTFTVPALTLMAFPLM